MVQHYIQWCSVYLAYSIYIMYLVSVLWAESPLITPQVLLTPAHLELHHIHRLTYELLPDPPLHQNPSRQVVYIH